LTLIGLDVRLQSNIWFCKSV